jgi:uroporphyrinogen decarboxylase
VNSRERLLTALAGGVPDRLPVTTHHLMPSFLINYLDGASEEEFFDLFGLDPIRWVWDLKPNEECGDHWLPSDADKRWICSDNWRIEAKELTESRNNATRYDIVTPGGTLSTVLEETHQTAWVVERLVKNKTDIELIQNYAPIPICDVDVVNGHAAHWGDRGIIRGSAPSFEIYGQPGCWQDAAVLFGIQALIMETFDDPGWVHQFLEVLKRRKLPTIASMKGAKIDIIELGGGDASSTVISPTIFEKFVAPYDDELIAEAHRVDQRVVYHTCGGMMPLLEQIADMAPDAMETFTPPSIGGDTDLAEAKARIGDRVCMIGGFDQWRHFQGCTPEETRTAVRRCFEEAGDGGGFILSPSDHFFDADRDLIKAFADEARACKYS